MPEIMTAADTELRELVSFCIKGDKKARTRFQTLFGGLIYKYPMNVFRLPADMAADFYIYVLENDRIFKRLGGFEGRNDAQFKTYLRYYVLRSLFFEWQRSRKDVETVSLEAPLSESNSRQGGVKWEDVIAAPNIDDRVETKGTKDEVDKLLSSLDGERITILKLLHLAEFDLTPQDIRFISQKSGRSYKEVVTIIQDIRSGLSKKDKRLTSLEDQLESIFGWILLYQKELPRLSEALESKSEGSAEYVRLMQEKEEIERKLEWRYRQREPLIAKVRQFRITTPYKDIARLLNVPVGTVCSWVARIREDVSKGFRSREAQSQSAVS